MKGDEQFRVNARAEAPFGKHFLVAVLTKTEDLDERVLDRVAEGRPTKDGYDKGVRLEGDDEIQGVAVRAVNIYKY